MDSNIFLLDEPTNHLDIKYIELLEGHIKQFKIVSHDRYFINKFANKILEFKNGNINLFLNNHDNYIEKIKEVNLFF